jgi:hypothetical protein
MGRFPKSWKEGCVRVVLPRLVLVEEVEVEVPVDVPPVVRPLLPDCPLVCPCSETESERASAVAIATPEPKAGLIEQALPR